MPQLGNFSHDRARHLKQVFSAKKEHILAPFLELLVIVGVVVRLPAELHDIEIGRDPKLPAEGRQRLLVQGFAFKAKPDPLNLVVVVAKSLKRSLRRGKCDLGIRRNAQTQSTGQSCFPSDELPFTANEAVLPAATKIPLMPVFVPTRCFH